MADHPNVLRVAVITAHLSDPTVQIDEAALSAALAPLGLIFVGAKVAETAPELTALGLNAGICTQLRLRGITTVDKLCARSEADLLAAPGIGWPTIRTINRALSEIGRSLAGRPNFADTLDSITPDVAGTRHLEEFRLSRASANSASWQNSTSFVLAINASKPGSDSVSSRLSCGTLVYSPLPLTHLSTRSEISGISGGTT
jgi:hypothetical protein